MWKVMVADDESYLLEAMKKLIAWEDMKCSLVYCAKNGQELIEKIPIFNPDIIITDIKMPLVDGLQVAKYVYESGWNIQVIILTGYADFTYAQEAIRYNVCEYIIKTSMIERLPETIKNATRKLQSLHDDQSLDDIVVQEDILFRLENYIKKNYLQRITLNDIAKAVHANRSYISRLYKNKTGYNLFDVINKMRIDKAKEYLDKGMKIYEVATIVGYEDAAYFSRVFKKIEGCSPKEYCKK